MQINRTQNQPNFKSRGAKIKFQNPDEIVQYLPQQGYLSLAKQTAVLKDLTFDPNILFGIHFDARNSRPVTLSMSKNDQPRVNRLQASGIDIHTISEEASKLLRLAKKDETAPILLIKPEDNALSRLYKRLLLGVTEKQSNVKVYNRDEMAQHLPARAIGLIWRQVRTMGNMAKDVKLFEIGFNQHRIAPFSVACQAKSSSWAQKQNLMNVEIAPTAKALKDEVLTHDESPIIFPRQKLTPSQIEVNKQILENIENL